MLGGKVVIATLENSLEALKNTQLSGHPDTLVNVCPPNRPGSPWPSAHHTDPLQSALRVSACRHEGD